MRRFFPIVLLVLMSLLTPAGTKAEYRAYQLSIIDNETGAIREVASTLDDMQYPGYFHVGKSETVQIKATWKCWERSDGFQPICPNPNVPAGPPAN